MQIQSYTIFWKKDTNSDWNKLGDIKCTKKEAPFFLEFKEALCVDVVVRVNLSTEEFYTKCLTIDLRVPP